MYLLTTNLFLQNPYNFTMPAQNFTRIEWYRYLGTTTRTQQKSLVVARLVLYCQFLVYWVGVNTKCTIWQLIFTSTQSIYNLKSPTANLVPNDACTFRVSSLYCGSTLLLFCTAFFNQIFHLSQLLSRFAG